MELPGGLEIVSTIVSIRPGTNHRLSIPIIKKIKKWYHTTEKFSYTKVTLNLTHNTTSSNKANTYCINHEYKQPRRKITKKVDQVAWNERYVNNVKEDQMKVLGQIDFSDLTTKERTFVQQILIEDANVFSIDDTDVGNITSRDINIKTQYQDPFMQSWKHI